MPAWMVFALDLILAGGAVEAMSWLSRTWLYPGAAVGFVGTTVSAIGATVAAALTAYLTGLHERDVLSRSKQVFARTTLAGLGSAFAALAAAYLYFYEPVGRVTIALWALSVGTVLGVWRLGYGAFLRTGPRVRLVVVGAGPAGRRFAELVQQTPLTRYEVVGFVDDNGPGDCEPPVLGRLDDTVELCERVGVRQVVVSEDDQFTHAHMDLLGQLAGRGLRVSTVGAAFASIAGRIPLDIVRPRWMLEAFDQIDRPGRAEVKRVLDVTMAMAGLAIAAIMLPVLYVAVRGTSAGPLLYRQPRVGLGGRTFTVVKIRTMTAARDAAQQWSSGDDARVTAVGGVLRKLRIDEFPQFWNVLKGEMSVVGPRPEQPDLVEKLQKENPYFHYRHLVKPGITGWAQIHQAYVSTVEDSLTKLSYDLYYVHRYGLDLDLDIILRTVFVMLSRVG